MHQSLASPVWLDDRRFFTGMAASMLAVMLAGFGASYYFWPLTRATHHANGVPIAATLPVIVHLHAVLFSVWLVLLIVQIGLVRQGQVAAHRRFGMLAAGLVPLMLVTGVATAIRGARHGWQPGGPYPDALGFLIVGFVDMAVFTSLTVAGLAWRRRPDLHKRLMLLGSVGGLMWPAVTRIPGISGHFPSMIAVMSALVLALATRDFVIGARARWVSLGVGLGILALFPARALVGNTQAWRAVASWLVQ